VTALEVRRDLVLCAETAKVDDPADAALARGGREVFRAATIGACWR